MAESLGLAPPERSRVPARDRSAATDGRASTARCWAWTRSSRTAFSSAASTRTAQDWLAAVADLDRARRRWPEALEQFVTLRVPLDRFRGGLRTSRRQGDARSLRLDRLSTERPAASSACRASASSTSPGKPLTPTAPTRVSLFERGEPAEEEREERVEALALDGVLTHLLRQLFVERASLRAAVYAFRCAFRRVSGAAPSIVAAATSSPCVFATKTETGPDASSTTKSTIACASSSFTRFRRRSASAGRSWSRGSPRLEPRTPDRRGTCQPNESASRTIMLKRAATWIASMSAVLRVHLRGEDGLGVLRTQASGPQRELLEESGVSRAEARPRAPCASHA